MSEPRRVVVFLCRCATHIADYIDLEALASWTASQEGVVAVETVSLLCAPQGKEVFREIVTRHAPEAILIAACSPRMHFETFATILESIDINRGRLLFCNIREQCAWVTPDRNEATEKAKALLRAALRRSCFVEELPRRTMTVNPDVCIIGGGMAGITAARLLARAERKVYLVEKEISLGGGVIRTEEIAPKMECAPCLLAPELDALKHEPRIEVIAGAEVTDVLGFFGNFTVRVRKRPRYVKSSCIGCEACFEACPVEVPHAFHAGLGKRKAIYTLFGGAVPPMAAIDPEHCLHLREGSCGACKPLCPFDAIDFEEKEEKLDLRVGALLLAIGCSYAEIPSSWRGIPSVYTLFEFERLAASNGPTGGKIRCANGRPPTYAAVIDLASVTAGRDGRAFWPEFSTLQAIKVGALLRHKVEGVRVYQLHAGLALSDPATHAFYQAQVEAGTRFLLCQDLASLSLQSSGDRVRITLKDLPPFEVDLVVLCCGYAPSGEAKQWAETLQMDLEESGWFRPDHPILHPTGTVIDGIYVIGSAGGPCRLPEAVTRARAAVGDLLGKLIPGREIELERMTSWIDPERCAGCRLCQKACPYKAIEYHPSQRISEVNEAICRGCGVCAATCPGGVITMRYFSDRQIGSEVEGLTRGG